MFEYEAHAAVPAQTASLISTLVQWYYSHAILKSLILFDFGKFRVFWRKKGISIISIFQFWKRRACEVGDNKQCFFFLALNTTCYIKIGNPYTLMVYSYIVRGQKVRPMKLHIYFWEVKGIYTTHTLYIMFDCLVNKHL